MKKILLVDDESDILEFLSYNLENAGYKVKVANNGEEGVRVAKSFIPDLILLDMMMPEMDGVETCEIIREADELNNVIIAFLTARGEDYSQIAGFDAGADDYILKPIKPKVLMSRVKALLKRSHSNETVPVNLVNIIIGDLEINLKRYEVVIKGTPINLPKKEFKLLVLLCEKPGEVRTREEIMDKVWGTEVIVGDRTIDVHIRKLREKLGEGIIDTIKGVGYKIVG
ncbi:MAG TPA: response regulator transcription factor [Flavobacteriales bacterium]|jgi:two-component system alkaline phosphatase synthesis response regulator PhoP|nr:response regulator transcription factor [Flavobacteriales bacterium]HIB76867.1 response regulator transcription factor [Flavobacteriales bacterium]HIN40824.1 response regulator transcription factor [Flavobacteriales bacterium]HIO16485.1 response regulator transcription factor [Flavobacteriales bacterium]HIO59218.1 response regulator transcription factor [Flavobacteriales bacterium]